MRPMQHVLTYNEQSLLDLANVDPTRFKEVIRVMISSLPPIDPKAAEVVYGGPTNEPEPTPSDPDPKSITTHRNYFRPLNENELHILWVKGGIAYSESDRGTWLESIPWDDLRVSYEELSSGFTICLITLKPTYLSTSFIWRGVSRCSYHDRPNRIKGEALAFIRAITESRPVEM